MRTHLWALPPFRSLHLLFWRLLLLLPPFFLNGLSPRSLAWLILVPLLHPFSCSVACLYSVLCTRMSQRGLPIWRQPRRESGQRVTAFDYFRLESPPTKGKEGSAAMTTRNNRNLVKMANILDTFDSRLDGLEIEVENLTTELQLRAGERASTTSGCAEDAHSGPHRDSDSAGSIGSVDEVEILGERVEEITEQLKDTVACNEHHEVRIRDLESRVQILETQLAPSATPAFSLLEMSTALSDQFKVIKQKHNNLDDVVKYQADALVQANQKHDLLAVELRATISRLESSVARLQLSPGATGPRATRVRAHSPARSRSPPRHSLIRSRSHSPDQSSAPKRARGGSTEDKPFILMGPVEVTALGNLLQILRIYMDARLPAFVLPEPPRIDVSLDPRQAKHLRVVMSAADVRALRNAWVEKGYNNAGSVKVVAIGLDNHRGPQVASSSFTEGNGRYFRAGSGTSGPPRF
ncbi:hypothetical protein B0H14DRAFT_3554377 [Mycena olivaceomarginata]|nr:hypothetical protein B0H14DRAFT_3554377 [Mycena olivaceomarginata]